MKTVRVKRNERRRLEKNKREEGEGYEIVDNQNIDRTKDLPFKRGKLLVLQKLAVFNLNADLG